MEKASHNEPWILVVSRDGLQAARRCAEISLFGRRAMHVEDFMEAMTLLRRDGPSLVLVIPPVSDLRELDLPKIVHEFEPFSVLPVIVQVQRAGEGLFCHYLKSGADDVITADTSGQELDARIHSLLRVKDLHDQLAVSRGALQQALDREHKLLVKLRRDKADLQELCTTDPLTRVQNVRSFVSILEHDFRTARRYGQPLSLLMLDVDHFKLVNDMHGHPAGDYVLKELAVILKRSVRESDVVSRTGGEEFTIVLPKADPRRCAVLAERVRREVAARQFAAYGRLIRVTISIGSTSFPSDAEATDPGRIVYLADQALLIAKETGRNRVVALHDLDADTRHRLCRQYQQSHRQEESQCDHPSPAAAED